MRIAFVSANREKLPDAVTPIGILYVMASTPEHHTKELWDLCFETDPLGYLASRLRQFRPDVVAVGMRNIQNSDYSGLGDTLDYYGQVVETIRAESSALVVLGGGGFSVMPQGLMKRLRPDFGISGEGERAFAQLVGQLEMGAQDFCAIEDLHSFVGRELVSSPHTGAFLDLDELPRPDRGLADGRYYTDFGIDSIQTKRGCSLRCDYCTYPTIEGRVVRQRAPAKVVDELFVALEQRPDIKHFFLVDSVFNLPPRHAKAVCREMIERRFDVPWTCYGNPTGFDRELAELMKEASCAGVEIGADSGCDDILDRLVKGFRTDQIIQMHEDCGAIGLPDCHTFLLGTPGETLEHVNRTLDFCKALDPFAAIMMIWTDDYEALDPGLAAGRRSFREDIKSLLHEREEDFPRWIMPSLGTNFDERLFRFLRRRGLSGPLWQHIKLVGRAEGSKRLGRGMRSLPGTHVSPVQSPRGDAGAETVVPAVSNLRPPRGEVR